MCLFSASARRIAAAAFFFSTVLYPALAQTNVESVFGDFMADQWVAEVWDCDHQTQKMEYDLDEQQVVSTGTNAVEVRYGCLGGYGGFGFTRRAPDWSQIFWMYPNQYRSVSFDFYCADTTTAAVAGLGLSLDIAGGTLAPIVNYINPPLRTGEWRHVQIPVSDCNPQGHRFARIFFFNNSQRNPHVFMDNVALHWVPDATPPVVRSVSVTNIGWTTATISFETDEYAYSRLFLGMAEPLPFALDSGDFLLSTTFHSTNLLPGTTYQFRLEVGDHQIGGAPSNTATFSGAFTTAPTNIPPVIGAVTVSGVRAESATISWSTRLPADSTVQYGMGGYSSTVHHATFSTNHVVTLTGLQPTATYQYRVAVQDPYGNTANVQQNPPLTFQTLAPVQAGLWADARTPVRPFSAAMRGANLVNWAIFYGRPYPNDSPKLRELTRLIKPGVLRHAGGLASNHILWDRANRQLYPGGFINGHWNNRMDLNPPVTGTNYTSEGVPQLMPGAYTRSYQADEIDDVVEFARYVGAEVMIEVNVNVCDPAMWADLVRYANVEHDYRIKYWELGNELDLERASGMTDAWGPEYVSRYKRYHNALMAVDPTIQVMGPTTASYTDEPYFRAYTDFIDPLTLDHQVRTQQMLNALSFHYYPRWNGVNPVLWSNIFAYGPPDDPSSRQYSTEMVAGKRTLLDSRGLTNTQIAITEMNAIAADNPTSDDINHASALFAADMLGRLAYAGADIACHWDLFDATGEGGNFGMIDSAGAGDVRSDGQGDWIAHNDTYHPNPVYYAYFLYAQLFGNQLVASTSSIPETLSFWASLDTNDPSRLYLLAVNLGDESVRATLQFDGFNPVKGRVWTMANPDFTASQNRDALRDGTRINGLQIDVTSAQTITNSAQAILNSGEVLANPKSPITRLLQPFSATVFWLENPKRNILSIAAETNSSVRLEFEGISRNYSILVTDSMKEPIIWTPVTNLTAGSNGMFQYVDPETSNLSSRYYRARVTNL